MVWQPRRFNAHAAYAQALLLAGAGAAFAAQDAKEPAPLRADEKKEEKPKEPPLKYSAWCAFRDLSDQRPAPKEDPTRDETRLASRQWTGFGRRGQWTTLVLELKNTTEKDEFKGTAAIQSDPVKENERGVVPYQTYYRQEFEIGPQTVKQYRFSVLCPEDGWNKPLELYLTANGRALPVRYVQLHDLDAAKEDFVVVVSESSGSFRHLCTRRQGPGNIEDDEARRHRKVAVVEPQELPPRWHDLTLANLIVIDGPPREQLTDAQWAALKSYVQAGGHILITAGKDPSRLKGTVEELAGVTVRGMIEVDRLDGGTSADLNWAPKDPAWKLPLVDVSVSPKGSPVVRYSQTTRKVEQCQRFYGSGSVTFLPYSLSDPRLEHWRGRNDIPVDIIEFGRGRRIFANTTVDDEMARVSSPNLWQPGYVPPTPYRASSLMGLRRALDQSFTNDTPVKPQEKGTVLSFLLLYLLCAVPGNYLLFGWLRRREIAWLAVPAWAATFSVIAYVVGYMGQTGFLTVNEVAVIEAGPGQDVGMARTFVGVYAPRRDEYRLEFPPVRTATDEAFDLQAAPTHLVDTMRGEVRRLDVPELHIVESGQALTVERLLVQQRSTRQLEIVHRARLGKGLDVNVRQSKDSSGALDVEVQNNTGFPLYYPVYVREGKAFPLGATQDNVLPPGAGSKLAGVTPAQGEDPAKAFFGRMVVLPSARGTHAQNRATALNEYVRTQADKYPHGVVCAWIDNEKGPLPVKVAAGWREAKEPRIEGLSLLLAPVTIKTDLTAQELPGGFRVACSQDYDVASGQGQWRPADGKVQFRRTNCNTPGRYNPNTPAFMDSTHLKVAVQSNYRAWAIAGLQLQLRFTLSAQVNSAASAPRPQPPRPPQPAQPAASPTVAGDVRIEVRRQLDGGKIEWTELGDALSATLRTGQPWRSPVIGLPWNDYRAVSDDSVIVRVSFVPNVAQQQVNYANVQLQNVECKAGKPGSW